MLTFLILFNSVYSVLCQETSWIGGEKNIPSIDRCRGLLPWQRSLSQRSKGTRHNALRFLFFCQFSVKDLHNLMNILRAARELTSGRQRKSESLWLRTKCITKGTGRQAIFLHFLFIYLQVSLSNSNLGSMSDLQTASLLTTTCGSPFYIAPEVRSSFPVLPNS